jgi:hypothetical protein
MTTCAVATLGPACLDLSVYAGDENALAVYLHQGDIPVDITAASFAAQAREVLLSDTVAIAATFEIVDGPHGVAVMRWDGEQVRTLMNGCAKWRGVWDLQAEVPGVFGGDPFTVAAGKWIARMDVTRSPG